MYYIYVYLDPRKPGNFIYGNYHFDFEPFYVGKGCKNRDKDHLHPTSLVSGRASPKVAKIKKLINLKLQPIIVRLDTFNVEQLAYAKEIEIIKLIGSDFITEIDDGPLTNMILDSGTPPSHKDKTYLEIYGTPERAEEQRKKRHERQLAVGGFYKGHKHSDKAKDKIGKSLAGNQNRKGIKHDEQTKSKMRLAQENRIPPNGKSYIIKNKQGELYTVFRLNDFCNEHNLSPSTLRKTMNTKIPAKGGKTDGWMIMSSFKPNLDQWKTAKKKGA